MFRKDSQKWFVQIKKVKNPHIKLFCFPHGGAGASTYNQWPGLLPEFVDMYAVQLPGRESRFTEPLLTDIEMVVDELSKIFIESSNDFFNGLNMKYLFFGHSIGALIAFELVQRLLETETQLPEHLIVSGALAPQLPLRRERIAAKPDELFFDEVLKYGGIPDYVFENPDLISVILPIIRADFSIFENYAYKKRDPLPIRISALGGIDDPTCLYQDLLSWKAQTGGEFRYYILPGDHFFIRSEFEKVMHILNDIIMCEIKNLHR